MSIRPYCYLYTHTHTRNNKYVFIKVNLPIKVISSEIPVTRGISDLGVSLFSEYFHHLLVMVITGNNWKVLSFRAFKIFHKSSSASLSI